MTQLTRRRDRGLEMVANLAPQQIGKALSRVTARAWEPIAFSLSQHGPLPDRLRALPRGPRRGNVARGKELLKGRYAFGGAVLELPRSQPWTASQPDASRFKEALHGFAWLADLGAVDRTEPGVNIARETARALLGGWLSTQITFSEPAWRPDIVGRRIISWLTEALLLAEGGDLIWRTRFNHALAWQARYLYQTADRTPEGLPRLTARIALVLACLALGDAGPRRQHASARLIAELAQQLFADGGHKSRSPTEQLDLAADLLILEEAYLQSHTPMPDELKEATRRAAGALTAFHIANGALAFTGESRDPETVLAILDAGAISGPEPSLAAHSGFHRLVAQSTLVLIDAPGAPLGAVPAGLQASPLGFELACDGERIVVCAGQQTLTLGDGAAPPGGAGVGAERHDRAEAGRGGSWLDLQHDLYAPAYGRRVARRLFLSERGGDLRGEDRIEAIEGASPSNVPFALRFQIHHGVAVRRNEGEAILELPSGAVWRFQCRGGALALADGPHKGRQLVIDGIAGAEPAVLRWAFKRETGEHAQA